MEKCSGSTWGGRMGLLPCVSKAKVERNGKHYCGMHDPVRVKERQDARDAKRNQENAARDQHWKREDERRAEMKRRYDCHDALVSALRLARSYMSEAIEYESPCAKRDAETVDAAIALAGETP